MLVEHFHSLTLMKIAVMGCKDFALGFGLGGVKTPYEVNENNYVELFEKCYSEREIGIIILEEQYYKKMPARIKKKLEENISPVVISISREDVGASDLGKLMLRVFGTDIWKEGK